MDVTPATRKAVWDGLIDAARMQRYAISLDRRYARQRLAVRLVLSLSASGGVATFLGALPEWAPLVFGLAVGVSVAFEFTMDYSTKLAKLMYTKLESAALLLEWEELWLDIETYACSEEDARERNRNLLRQLNRTSTPVTSDLHVSDKVNREVSEHAYSDMALRFSQAARRQDGNSAEAGRSTAA